MQEELPVSPDSGAGNPGHWRCVNRARGTRAPSSAAFCHTLGGLNPD